MSKPHLPSAGAAFFVAAPLAPRGLAHFAQSVGAKCACPPTAHAEYRNESGQHGNPRGLWRQTLSTRPAGRRAAVRHARRPRRRSAAKGRRFDHRPDFLRVDVHLHRHPVGHRLHRAAANPRGVRPLRQPRRTDRRAEAGGARRRRGSGAFLQRHGGDRRAVDGQAQRRRRGDLFRRVLPPQPRVLRQAPLAVRRHDAASAGLRLRRHGGRHHAADPVAGERVADQSAPELRRPGAFRRNRRRPGHRNADRRHARHAVQPATDCRGHRLCAALGHQVSRRAQRPAGRRRHRRQGEDGAGPQPARHHGRRQRPAERLPAAPRAQNLRAAHAAAQRKRHARGRVPGGSSARRAGVLPRLAVAPLPRGGPQDDARFRRDWSRS